MSKLIFLFFLLVVSVDLLADPGAVELPIGGQINQGVGAISQRANVMTINQASQVLNTQWQQFNIGKDATVNILQPSVNSTFIGNIVGGNASSIFGNLNANGNVVLVNPSGLVFGSNAQVDVGGIVASTLALRSVSSNGSTLDFFGNSTAKIEQNGFIKGGFVTLIGLDLEQLGTIKATSGDLGLLASDHVGLEIGDSGRLSLSVSPSNVAARIKQSGYLAAPNGQVFIQADVASQLLADQLNRPSQQRTLTVVDGKLQLINVDGSINASSVKLDAGDQGELEISGKLQALDQQTKKGGRIDVLGGAVAVKDSAILDASGDGGGGLIQVGGSWQNSDMTVRQSVVTRIDVGARLSANSLLNGDAGQIVAWSDIYNNNSLTVVKGDLTAQAIGLTGNGGRLETSGHLLDVHGAKIFLNGVSGANNGLWLLDPLDVYIQWSGSGLTGVNDVNGLSDGIALYDLSNVGTVINQSSGFSYINNGDIQNVLASGNNVVIKANRDLQVNEPIQPHLSSNVSLTLQAGRNIVINKDIWAIPNSQSINCNSACKLDLVLFAESDNTAVNNDYGSVSINAPLRLNGGSVTLGDPNNSKQIIVDVAGTGSATYGDIGKSVNFVNTSVLEQANSIYDYKLYSSKLQAGYTFSYTSGQNVTDSSQSLLDEMTTAMTYGSSSINNGFRVAGQYSGADKLVVGDYDIYVGGNWSPFTTANGLLKNYAVTINPKTLSISPLQVVGTISVATKQYDGLTSATTSLSLNNNFFAADNVTAQLAATANFASKNVAYNNGAVTSQSVSASSSLVPAHNGQTSWLNQYQYTDNSSGLTGTILPKELTVAGHRAYDASTLVNLGDLSITGFVQGENLILSGSATAASSHAGSATLSSIGGLTKFDGSLGLASNYNFLAGVYTIDPKVVNVSGSKIYDGYFRIEANEMNISTGIVGETLTIALPVGRDANLSANQAKVNSIHVVNTQNGAGVLTTFGQHLLVAGANTLATDYQLPIPSDAAHVSITINPKEINLTGSNFGAFSKTYDGTTSAPSGAVLTSTGLYGLDANDTITVSFTSGLFNNKNVQDATTFNLTGGSVTSIVDNANYRDGTSNSSDFIVGNVSTAGTILPLTLTASQLRFDVKANPSDTALSLHSDLNAPDAIFSSLPAADVLTYVDNGTALSVSVNSGKLYASRNSIIGDTIVDQNGKTNYVLNTSGIAVPSIYSVNARRTQLQIVNSATPYEQVYNGGQLNPDYLTSISQYWSVRNIENGTTYAWNVSASNNGTLLPADCSSGMCLLPNNTTRNTSFNASLVIPSNQTVVSDTARVNISNVLFDPAGNTANESNFNLLYEFVDSQVTVKITPRPVYVDLSALNNNAIYKYYDGTANVKNQLTALFQDVSTSVSSSNAGLLANDGVTLTPTYDVNLKVLTNLNAGQPVAPSWQSTNTPLVNVSKSQTGEIYPQNAWFNFDQNESFLSGAKAANYVVKDSMTRLPIGLSSVNRVSVYVLPKPVTLSATKAYDGTSAFTLSDIQVDTGINGQELGLAVNTATAGSILGPFYINQQPPASPNDSNYESQVSYLRGLAGGMAYPDRASAVTKIANNLREYQKNLASPSVMSFVDNGNGSYTEVINKTSNPVSLSINGPIIFTAVGNENVNNFCLSDCWRAPEGLHSFGFQTKSISTTLANVNGTALVLDTPATATITARSVTITPNFGQSKSINSNDPNSYTYASANVVSGETLNGGISRQAGEAAGQYGYTLGNLASTNPNYSFTLSGSNTFAIIDNLIRLSLTGLVIQNKTYDGTTSGSQTLVSNWGNLTGAFVGSDGSNVNLDYSSASLTYSSKDVGSRTLTISGLSLTGTNANHYIIENQIITATILQKALNVSGLIADSKTYDGYDTAALSGSVTLIGNSLSSGDGKFIGAESVSIAGTPVGRFVNKNAGQTKEVLVSGLQLSGSDASNYTLIPISLSASIARKSLYIDGISASNKTYDGSASATVVSSAAVYTGLVSGDSVGILATGSFTDKNVGLNKQVSLTTSYVGNDKDNYDISSQSSTSAGISAKQISLSGLQVQDKAYDATDTAVASSYGSFIGLVTGDDISVDLYQSRLTFNDAQVGANKLVTLRNFFLTGQDWMNYSIASSFTAHAAICDGQCSLAPSSSGVDTASILAGRAQIEQNLKVLTPYNRLNSSYIGSTATVVAIPDMVAIDTKTVPLKLGNNDITAFRGVFVKNVTDSGFSKLNPVAKPIFSGDEVGTKEIKLADLFVNPLFDSSPDKLLVSLGDPNKLPVWVKYNESRGTLVLTPGAGDTGKKSIQITVMDPQNNIASMELPLKGDDINSSSSQENESKKDKSLTQNESGATGADGSNITGVNQSVSELKGFVAVEGLNPKTIASGDQLNYEVPKDTFVHGNSTEPLQFSATLANGDPIPSWMTFNAATKTFTGQIPPGQTGSQTVVITAIDTAQQRAQVEFNITIK